MPRIRPEGGVVGLNNTPTLATTTGMWSMQDVVRNLRNSTWPAAASLNDPYFNLNSLLIHADSTNGKTNVSYVDSSSNAYTATASGTPYQGTFSPFSQTGWSNYFDGTGDYLTAPLTFTDWCNSSTWTIEGWFNFGNFLSTRGMATCQDLLQIYATQTTLNIEYRNTPASAKWSIINATVSLSVNTWYHVAFVLSGGIITAYLNGTSVGTVSAVGNGAWGGTGSNNTLYIGTNDVYTFGSLDSYMLGYISNFRITTNAQYTSTFTPSTTSLTAITNTKILTCQSNRLMDNSTNNFTITRGGDVTVQSFEPFAPGDAYSTTNIGGSAYFNGSTDYITLPNNMTVVGNGAYTLEGWFYPTTTSAGEIPIVKLYNSTQTIELRIVSNKIQGRINGSATIIGGNTTLYPNQWYHFALVKPTAGTSTAVLYINGVAESTTASDTTTYTAFTTPRVGANQSPNLYYTGWASGVRFVRAAQYSGNFTPPTAPPTNVASTLFLLNFTNAGIIDQTSKNNMITNGSAAVSTTQSKFGGSSIAFNGSTSYVNIPSNQLFDLGTVYTIEFWMYPNSLGSGGILHRGFYQTGIDTWTSPIAFSIRIISSTLRCYFWGTTVSNEQYIDASPAPSIGAWNHVAMVRNGTTGAVYINGVSAGTITGLNTPSASSRDLRIGLWDFSAGNFYYDGYLDDIRITRGVARYTTNFTPPVSAFTDF